MFLLKKIVIDKDKVKITGYGEVEDRSEYGEDLYVEVSGLIYEYVKENINRNDVICQLIGGDITIDGIELIPKDELNNLRNIVIKTFRKYFVDRHFDSEFYITFINYTRLNNKLSSKGYFITDDNREDVYLEIINTDDMDLIDLLDEFLMVMDEISEYDSAMKVFSDFKTNVNNLMDISDIKELFKSETGMDFDLYYNELGGNF
jgi:hypothetical protein